MAWSRWLIPALAVAVAHCGSTEPAQPSPDAGLADASDTPVPLDLPRDTASEAGDDVHSADAPTDDTPADAPTDAPADALTDATPHDADALLPTEDVVDGGAASEDAPDVAALAEVPALDAPAIDVATIDAPLIEDIAVPREDLPPVDVPPTRDAGPQCPNGMTDGCPSATPGPCPTLVGGMSQVVRFSGFTADVATSCEGSLTRGARDGVIPLTITGPSDVTISAQPSGGDVVVLALFRSAGCGLPSGELRCVNPSASGSTARVSATSLEPGTYFVSVSALAGNPVTLTANVTPARPRRRGDVCPGIPITPDAAPVSLSTNGFQSAADYGTSCGAGSTSSSWVDAVFSYTLTAPRDVTLDVTATGSGDIAVDVTSSCGVRAAAVPPCTSGGTVRRVLRNQQPGTWYVTVDHRATSGGRTIVAGVATAPPTLTGPADRCPGVSLVDGVTTAVSVATLGGDASLSCVRAQRVDGFFSFTAPPPDQDVLVNVRGNASSALGFALQSTCGAATVGACVGTADRAPANLWARYRGLTQGATYTVFAGTAQSTGDLAVRYLAVPAVTPTASTNMNTSCARATPIPASGGYFTGSTAGGDRALSVYCGAPGCIGSRNVYYRLTLAERRRVVINTAGSGFDTFVNVLTGECPGRAVDGACSDDASGTTAMVDATLDAGIYTVMLGGCGAGAQGTYALDVSMLPP